MNKARQENAKTQQRRLTQICVFRFGVVICLISILSLQTDELSIEEIKAILAANNCPHVVHDEVTHGNKQNSCGFKHQVLLSASWNFNICFLNKIKVI